MSEPPAITVSPFPTATPLGPDSPALPPFALGHAPDHEGLVDRGASPAELAALGGAAACPDLFLIDAAPGDDQLGLAAEIARGTRRRGERVLVLTAEAIDADKLLARFRAAGEVTILRALGAGEPANQIPKASAERVSRAHGEVAVQQARARADAALQAAHARHGQLEAAAKLWEPADAARARLAALNAEHASLREVTAPPARSAELAARIETLERDHAAAGQTREQLAHEAEGKKGGFLASVKRLFGEDVAPGRLAAVEATLLDFHRDLVAARAERAELLAAHEAAEANRARSLAAVEAELLEHGATLDGAHAAFAAAGLAERWPTADELTTTLLDAQAEAGRLRSALDSLDAEAPAIARRLIDAVGLVVGPLSSLAGDAALQSPARFDQVILTDAELLTEQELAAVQPLASRWVLLGDDGELSAHGNGARNGNGARRRVVTLFHRMMARHHAPRLRPDHGRLTAQLLPVPAGTRLHCEPLADQPDIELRFLPGYVGPRPAEVSFPPGTTAAAAKSFLARELGEYAFRLAGPLAWGETAEHLVASVPGLEATARHLGDDHADLGDGVTEHLVGRGADGWTACVRFARGHGWTLDAAQAWLAELTPPAARAVRMPRPLLVAERSPARHTAGVGG